MNVNLPLAKALALAVPAATLVLAATPSLPEANVIKRYLLSADTFEAVQAQLQAMKVVFPSPLKAPTQGRPLKATGTGPSGFAAPYVIEAVGGHFHLYVERRRPQHPAGFLPYVQQEVVFGTPNAEVSPVGTLSFPKGKGPFPGVVLLAGTGAHTRDGMISLHKQLLVLADHLTRQGFAVLRYDKRGVGLTGGQAHPGSTTDDYADDALAALRFLQIQPQVDPARVGLVGHSEGGILAPMVAARAPRDVAFVVMLAGTGLPGLQVKSLQDAAARRADGMPEPLVRANGDQERELYEIAAGPKDHNAALAAMRAATQALPPEVKRVLEIPSEGLPDEAFEALLSPWFRRFLALDPRTHLEKVICPVLALIGGKDLQVPAEQNLPEIEGALMRGSNRHATILQLPGLNHFFQTARTGKDRETLLIEETFAPSALRTISTWIHRAVPSVSSARPR